MLFPALGAAPLERAEIYFLDGARSMVERNDWLVPHYRGEPFFDKPVLTYWLMAFCFRLFGFAPGAARLVPALAALVVVALTAWLGSLLFDRRTGLAGAAILATTVAFVAFGRIAMSDMLLTLWTVLAFALAVRAYRSPAPAWLAPALGASLGLGFLTKGPVAILLPGLGILALAWWRRREPWPWTLRGCAAGVGLFAVCGLGWFVLVYLRLGFEPLAYFFLRENLGRFAGDVYDAGRPVWYYLPTYLAEGLPWSLFFPLAAGRMLWGRDATGNGRLLLAFLLLALVPLSLSRGKIDYYLLPLYPVASLVVARLFAAGEWDALGRGWSRGVVGVLAVMVLAAPALVMLIPAPWLPSRFGVVGLAVVAIVAITALVRAALRPAPGRVLASVAAATLGMFVTLASVFLPAFRAAQPHGAVLHDVLRERTYRPDASMVLCQDPARLQRDVLFYARLAAEERCDLWISASSKQPYLFLLSEQEATSILSSPGVREINRYSHLPATALTLEGLFSAPRPASLVLSANYETDDPVAESRRRQQRKRALEQEFGER